MWLKFTLLEHDKKVKERHWVLHHEPLWGAATPMLEESPAGGACESHTNALTMQSVLSRNGRSRDFRSNSHEAPLPLVCASFVLWSTVSPELLTVFCSVIQNYVSYCRGSCWVRGIQLDKHKLYVEVLSSHHTRTKGSCPASATHVLIFPLRELSGEGRSFARFLADALENQHVKAFSFWSPKV